MRQKAVTIVQSPNGLIEWERYVGLPGGNLLHALMVVLDLPPRRGVQGNFGRTEQVQAIDANRPHRLASERWMKVRIVMWIMSVHDALERCSQLDAGNRRMVATVTRPIR